MGFLVNDRKLKAAIGSMHQFCHNVREIFPGDVDDRVVEASTAYLYMSLVHDLFLELATIADQLDFHILYASAN